MTTISGSIREVKPQAGVYSLESSYELAKEERKALDEIKAALRAGKFLRCPCCLGWLNDKRKACVMSHSLRTPDTNKVIRFVAFPICKPCFQAFTQDRNGPQKLVKAVNAYFAGEYVEVGK